MVWTILGRESSESKTAMVNGRTKLSVAWTEARQATTQFFDSIKVRTSSEWSLLEGYVAVRRFALSVLEVSAAESSSVFGVAAHRYRQETRADWPFLVTYYEQLQR